MARKTKSKKILRYHLFLTVSVTVAYVVLGLAAGSKILINDVKHKARVAGSTVSAMVRVFGAPDKPSVEVEVGCNESEAPYVYLSWDEDEDATAFDIYRGGSELMLDVTDNYYTDENVTIGLDYEYYVVARGPGGTSDASETVTANVGSCPISGYEGVAVTIFDGTSVSGWDDPYSSDRTPTFSGITSIPSADINIYIDDEIEIYATTEANENGSWQWTAPVDLSYGSHILYLVSNDPLNSAISYSGNFSFRTTEEEDDDSGGGGSSSRHKKKKKSTKTSTVSAPAVSTLSRVSEKPFDFEVDLNVPSLVQGVAVGEKAYRGENLEIIANIGEVSETNDSAEIVYEFFPSGQETSYEFSDLVSLQGGERIKKNFLVPYDWELGKYKLQVSIISNGTVVSRDAYFTLEDRPIIDLGNTLIMKVELISNLGWLLVLCLIVLLIISGMVIWEHHLANGALFHVTGRFLKGKGYIS